MHVHPSSPQAEINAATKIQAGFRGYRVRKQILLKQNKAATTSTSTDPSSSTTYPIKSKGNGNKIDNDVNNNINYNNPTKIEDKSATTIQANVRGYLVRKKQKVAAEAATKIQASFRGFKTRKELNSKNNME